MTLKVFKKESKGPFEIVNYCVDGLHVYLIAFLGAVRSREVVSCDGTCKNLPAIQEAEVAEVTIKELRKLLGKGPIKSPPVM